MNSHIFRTIPLTLGVFLFAACGGINEAEEHYNAGNELREQGYLQWAILRYDESLRLDPQLSGAYVNRGATYDDLGQYERAIEDYNSAIRLDPQSALAYENRGVIYFNMGIPEQAIKEARTVDTAPQRHAATA